VCTHHQVQEAERMWLKRRIQRNKLQRCTQQLIRAQRKGPGGPGVAEPPKGRVEVLEEELREARSRSRLRRAQAQQVGGAMERRRGGQMGGAGSPRRLKRVFVTLPTATASQPQPEPQPELASERAEEAGGAAHRNGGVVTVRFDASESAFGFERLLRRQLQLSADDGFELTTLLDDVPVVPLSPEHVLDGAELRLRILSPPPSPPPSPPSSEEEEQEQVEEEWYLRDLGGTDQGWHNDLQQLQQQAPESAPAPAPAPRVFDAVDDAEDSDDSNEGFAGAK
jgi:hypothetical protein